MHEAASDCGFSGCNPGYVHEREKLLFETETEGNSKVHEGE